MTNITDIAVARDRRQQTELNDIWDNAKASGMIYTPSMEDDFHCLRIRDSIDRKVRAHDLITDQFEGDRHYFKLSTEYPAHEFSDDLVESVATSIADEIIANNQKIGYIVKIVINSPFALNGKPFDKRKMMIAIMKAT